MTITVERRGIRLGFGLVEGKEDRRKERCRLLVWIRLMFGINVDDEGRADCGEETRLRNKVRGYRLEHSRVTHKY